MISTRLAFSLSENIICIYKCQICHHIECLPALNYVALKCCTCSAVLIGNIIKPNNGWYFSNSQKNLEHSLSEFFLFRILFSLRNGTWPWLYNISTKIKYLQIVVCEFVLKYIFIIPIFNIPPIWSYDHDP